MLTQERRRKILDLLEEQGSVTVARLSEEFNSSESTIRRDLVALSQLGKLNKVHGGATVLSQQFLKMRTRLRKNRLNMLMKRLQLQNTPQAKSATMILFS